MEQAINMKSLLLTLFVISTYTIAAGPEKIASFDRQYWPEPLTNEHAFNKASRFELFHFLTAMEKIDFNNQDVIVDFTHVKKANLASVAKWKILTEKRLLRAFIAACTEAKTANTIECKSLNNLSAVKANMSNAYAKLDLRFDQWKIESAKFHQRYLYEQVRLAALFPRITSEILPLDKSELNGFDINGYEMNDIQINSPEIEGYKIKDKQFLLTFDDGPSQGSSTQNIIATLNKHNINGLFFMLGERLETLDSTKAKSLYQNQCVSSHGYIHKAHPKYDKWQESLERSFALIADKLAVPQHSLWFRPPYGQRSDTIIKHLQTMNSQGVMLWNIDSQDWNRKLNTQKETDRLITLMLLWRKGIILFHDLYEKNVQTVENLANLGNKTSLTYVDCMKYSNGQQ